MTMLELHGIKTAEYYFIGVLGKSNWENPEIGRLFFDGEKSVPTNNGFWVKLAKRPSLIQREVSQPSINHRFELKDMSLKSEKFPAVLKRQDVCVLVDYSWEWKEPFEHLASLYSFKEDHQANVLENVEFKIVSEIEFSNYKDMGGFSYPVAPDKGWGRDHDGRPITDRDATNQLLDTILFPPILLPQMPCKLSSVQAYKIVRKHIKDSIDLRFAKISSDYDFCFTVEKIVPLAEEEAFVIDENFTLFGPRKRRQKLVKKFRRDRSIKIFEMTNDHDNYKGYTPIKPIIGINVDDLRVKVDAFLKSLMDEINEPVKDCKTCNGFGVIFAAAHVEEFK